ncbi:MAG: calcium-binding protein [Propionibacteriaceae bacterium]
MMNSSIRTSAQRTGLAVAALATLVGAGALAAEATTAASAALGGSGTALAAPAPNATAAVVNDRLAVTGGPGSNSFAVSLASPARYLVTDNAPITVGDGCVVVKVAAPRFGVTCRAVQSAGVYLSFKVDLGAGDDRVETTAPGRMSVLGGPGNDTMIGGPSPDSFFDTTGRDTMIGNGGGDSLFAASKTDTLPDNLNGGAGDDDLTGGAGADLLSGGAGDDQLKGGLGADVFDGGPGQDRASYADNRPQEQRVFVNLNNIADDGSAPLTGPPTEKDNVRSTIEHVVGGIDARNTLVGGPGPDVLVGSNNLDTLIGNGGADRLLGRGGGDVLYANGFQGPVGDGALDQLDGGTEIDLCRIKPGEDVVTSCEQVDNT